ncbi:unnamed protein product [Trichobilharzia regenti]|nr:unnamed protein product [Trichobilharzia regenti]
MNAQKAISIMKENVYSVIVLVKHHLVVCQMNTTSGILHRYVYE